jgi:PAS domain S-box-containing protein
VGFPVSRRERKLDSLGLKLNLALLVLFLVIGGATAAFVFFGFNRTRDSATDRSREALENQGADLLQYTAFVQADTAAIELEWAAEIGHRTARYLQEFQRSGAGAPASSGELARTPDGAQYDPNPNRTTDLVMPNYVDVNDAVLRDIEYSAPMDALMPALFEGFPGELTEDAYHPIALSFLTPNGVARYYPAIGLQNIVPADLKFDNLLASVGPEGNPAGETVWSTPYQDAAGKGLVITANAPVYEDGVFRGAIQVDLSISKLVEQVNEVHPTETGFAFYVDKEGAILHTDAYDLLVNELNSQQNTELAAIVERMKNGEAGIDRIFLGGREYFLASAEIGGVAGSLAVAAPVSELTAEAAAITAEIDDQADQTMLYVLVSLTALFAVALLASTYLNRRVLVRPITELAAGTRAVAQGAFGTRIPVRGNDELAALGRSFNQMTEDIQREVHEREAAQEELRALFAAMTDAVVVINKDGLYLRVPPTNAPPILMPPEDLAGKYMADVMPPGQAEGFMSAVHEALEKQETSTIEYPLEIDDRSYWFSAAISPISAEEVVVVARDITDRVNARQELERQVKERTQELTSLLNVSRNIASNLALQPLVQTIFAQVKDIADYSRSSVFVLDGDGLAMLDSRTRDASPSPTMRVPLADIAGMWERIGAGEVAIEGDVRNSDSPIAQSYRKGSGDLFETAYKDIHSWMGVPLESNDRIVGMLTLSHNELNFYTEHHAELVSAIATQVAVAIENARLYEQAQQLAAVEERQRLARELHDSVSQALYGIALGARTARTLIDREPEKAAEPVDYVLSLAEAGLAEMRALIFELRPESLEIEGLMAALDKQVAATAARYGIEVTADLAEEPEMDVAQKEIFYRIGQEALHNVVKHAHATKATVRFDAENGSYVLEIGDDGVGFDTNGSFPGHMGLVSMSERAGSIGASLEVRSKPGEGTVVKLRSASRK